MLVYYITMAGGLAAAAAACNAALPTKLVALQKDLWVRATEARLGGPTVLDTNPFVRKTQFDSYFRDYNLYNVISITQHTAVDP